jgi:hypothetical protein
MKEEGMGRLCNMYVLEEIENAYKILVGKSQEKGP